MHEHSAPDTVTVSECIKSISAVVQLGHMMLRPLLVPGSQNSPVGPEIHCAETLYSLQLFQFTEDFFPARRELEMKADLQHV